MWRASCVLFYQSGRRSRPPGTQLTGKASTLSCEFLLPSRTNSRALGIFETRSASTAVDRSATIIRHIAYVIAQGCTPPVGLSDDVHSGIPYFPTNIAGPTLGPASKASTESTDQLIPEAVGLAGAEGRLEALACCG